MLPIEPLPNPNPYASPRAVSTRAAGDAVSISLWQRAVAILVAIACAMAMLVFTAIAIVLFVQAYRFSSVPRLASLPLGQAIARSSLIAGGVAAALAAANLVGIRLAMRRRIAVASLIWLLSIFIFAVVSYVCKPA